MLKVIVETALLDTDELVILSQLVSESGADFIKTSTGFLPVELAWKILR